MKSDSNVNIAKTKATAGYSSHPINNTRPEMFVSVEHLGFFFY